METEAKRENTRSLFKLVKSLVKELKVGLNVIKSSAGEVPVEPKAIASRWKSILKNSTTTRSATNKGLPM